MHVSESFKALIDGTLNREFKLQCDRNNDVILFIEAIKIVKIEVEKKG